MSKSEHCLNRRRFLKGAGAAALAAFLSACGARNPATPTSATTRNLPTATSTPSSTPTATASATPGQIFQSPLGPGGAFQSPLHSPLPTGTDVPPSPSPSPPPTATPTPPPTPFPPGPPTKLGLFVGWYHPQIMELVATRNVALLKTLELDPSFLAEVRARSPETIIVGRTMLHQLDLEKADPVAEARRAADSVLSLAMDERRKGLVDAWEGFNEPVPGDKGQMQKLATLEQERVRLLAEQGQRAVVGNFGTGHPSLEWWGAFRPALEAAKAQRGYLGLHEYSAPTIWYHTNREPLDFRADASDEGWLTLRYRKVYRQFLRPWGLDLPLLITECGVDGLVQDRPGPPGQGWKDFAGYWAELGMGWDTAGNYIEQLAWYDSQLQMDSYVKGASIFAMTAFQEWESYQLQGEAAEILEQYLSVHPPR
jgi:hypothetical protein